MLDKQEVKKKVSLTFLGTSHTRSVDLSLLTEVYSAIEKHAETHPEVATRLFDGVGCDGTEEHPTPGTYTFDFKNNTKTKRFKFIRQAAKRAIDFLTDIFELEEDHRIEESSGLYKNLVQFWDAMRFNKLRRKITGDGVDALVFEAQQYIQHIVKENNGVLPEEVVLQGFSRGADTCVRIANVLKYLNINVKLLLIDPVPGPGRRHDEHSFIIPDNVVSCQIVTMANEHHLGYKPQDRDSYVFEGSPEVKFNTLTGNHGAGIVRKPGRVIGSDESYRLVLDSLLKFNMNEGLLAEDHEITREYALVNNRFRSKDLTGLPNYTLHDGRDIKGKVTYSDVSSVMRGNNNDGILFHNNKVFYVNRAFECLEEIDVKNLSDDDKKLIDMLLGTFEHGDGKITVTDVELRKRVRKLVAPSSYKLLSAAERFKLFCDSFADFEKKCARRPVKSGSYYRRDALMNRANHVRDADLFLDEEHRSLFMELYPHVFAWYAGLNNDVAINQKVEQELQCLQTATPGFAKKLEEYLDISINDIIESDVVNPPMRILCTEKSSYGKKLRHDALASLRASIQNVVNRCRHRQLTDKVDIKLYKELAKSLVASNNMHEDDAVRFLADKIGAILIRKEGGFVYQEAQGIMKDPNQLLIDLRDELAEYSCNIGENHHKILLSFAKDLLEDDMPLEFSWEKYLAIRDNMIRLRAQLFDYDECHLDADAASPEEKAASKGLCDYLEKFYKESYGAKTVADKLIEKLRSYQAWSKLFSYFPSFFGWFDKERYETVDVLIEHLQDFNNRGKGDDLNIINEELKVKMQEIFKQSTEKRARFSGVSFMSSYLSNIITRGIFETELDSLSSMGVTLYDDESLSPGGNVNR